MITFQANIYEQSVFRKIYFKTAMLSHKLYNYLFDFMTIAPTLTKKNGRNL